MVDISFFNEDPYQLDDLAKENNGTAVVDCGVTSMARTTGYTCTIITRELLRGMIPHKGICPPEFIGQTESYFEDLLEEYRKRQIHLQETVPKRPLGAD